MKISSIVCTASILMVAGVGHAEDMSKPTWGTPEAAAVCTKDCDYPNYWYEKPSAECQAEWDKRAQACLDDPDAQKIYKDPKYTAHEDPKGYCKLSARWALERSMTEYDETCKKKKSEDDAKAKLEATELPKANMHDAKLEKAVRVAFDKDYPGNKILLVILDGWSDDYEKDAFGQITGRDLSAVVVYKDTDGKCIMHDEYWLQHGNGRSFYGPLSARGAGSASDTEILCRKVEKAPAPAKKK